MAKKVVNLAVVTVLLCLILVSPISAGVVIKKNPQNTDFTTIKTGPKFVGMAVEPVPDELADPIKPSPKGGVPPGIIVIDPPPNHKSNHSNNAHVFTVLDPDDDTVHCRVWYDNASKAGEYWVWKWENLNTPADGSQITAVVTEVEEHWNWKIRCYDGESPPSQTVPRALEIDTTAPRDVILPPNPAPNIGSNYITWVWDDPPLAEYPDFDHVNVSVYGYNYAVAVELAPETETYTATGLTPGFSYTIYLSTVDDVDNIASPVIHTASTIPDWDDPVISFIPDTPADGATFGRDWIAVNVSATDDNLDFVKLIWDDGTGPVEEDFAFENPLGDDTYWINKTGLSSGDYTFQAYARDSPGNTAYTETRTVTLDTSGPGPVTGLDETDVGETWIYWVWTNPTDADFDHVEILLDGISQGTSTDEYFNATGLSPGTTYTLTVTAYDTAGNPSTPAVDDATTLTVDNLPTFDFVRISPDPADGDDDLVCEFQFQDAESVTLDADITWFESTVQDNTWDNNIPDATRNTQVDSSGPTATETVVSESWECEVTLHDRDGDVTLRSSSVTIGDVPNTAPVISYVDLTPDVARTDDDLACSFLADDLENTTLYADIAWYLDGSPIVGWDVTDMQITAGNVENAPSAPTSSNTAIGDNWTCEVTVTDEIASDTDSDFVIIGDIPNTAPGVFITTPDNWYVADLTPTIDYYFIDMENATADATLYFGVSAVATEYDVPNGSTPTKYITPTSAQTETSHIYYIEVDDGKDIGTSTPLQTLTIDITDPEIAYIDYTDADGQTYVKNWISVNVTATDLNLDTVVITFDGVDTVFAPQAGDAYWINMAGLDSRDYTFSATATDLAGNSVSTLPRTVTLDYEGPDPVSNLHETDVGETWIYWVWVNPTADFDHVELYLNGTANGTTAGSFVNVTGLQPDTLYELTVIAVDSYGNPSTSESDEARTLAPNTVPTIYIITPDGIFTSDTTPDIQYYYTDLEDSTADVTLYFDGSAVGTELSVAEGAVPTKTISPTSAQSEGTHNYYIEVDDGRGTNTSIVQTITIDTAAPSIFYIDYTDPDGGIFDKDWISINVTAYDDLVIDNVWLEWNDGSGSVDVPFAQTSGDEYWTNYTGLAYGTYTFRAWANDSAGSVVSTGQRIVILQEADILPTFDFVRINPANPVTTNNLVCEFQFQDPEDATLQADIIWYRNGAWFNTWDETIPNAAANTVVASTNGPTSAQTQVGQTWQCEVTLTDQYGTVTQRSDPVTIINFPNTAPQFTWIDVTPDNPLETQDLFGSFLAYDNENTTLTADITWYNGGTNIPTWDQTIPVTSNIAVTNVPGPTSADTSVGETWYFEATLWDGIESTALNASETIQSVPITAPQLQWVNVTPDNPTSADNLACDFLFTDSDDPTVLANITWYRDSTNVPTWDQNDLVVARNTQIFTPSAPLFSDTSTGEIWYCEVTVEDSVGDTDSMNGSETIQSASPNTVPIVYVTTTNATNTTDTTPTINYYFTDSEDARGDANLYFNGSAVATELGVLEGSVPVKSITPTSPLADGLYWFWVDVSDGTGVGQSLNYTIRIDTNGTFLNLFYNPNTDPDGGIFSKDWILVNVTAKDPAYANLYFEFSDSNGLISNNSIAYTGVNSYAQNFAPLLEETYTFRVYAEDAGGTLIDATGYRTVTLDWTAVNITNITTDPEDGFENNGSEQNISINFTSDEYPINVTFNLYFENVTLVDSQGPTTVNSPAELPIIYTIPAGLESGNYFLYMTIDDSAGNSITILVSMFVVNNPQPSPSPSGGGGGGGGYPPSVNWTGLRIEGYLGELENETLGDINPSVDLDSEFSGILIMEGETKTVTFTVSNSGDIPDVYTISVDGPGWATVSNSRISLEPGESMQILLVMSPQIGDAGDYIVRATADSQNEPTLSTWDFTVRVIPAAGGVTAFITFVGGRAGAALVGLLILALMAAIFWGATSNDTRERIKSRFRRKMAKDTEKAVKKETAFLNNVMKLAEEPSQVAAGQTRKIEFTQRKDKHLWEV